MKNSFFRFLGLVILVVPFLYGSQAEAGSGLYDFSKAFSQPHPFASQNIEMPWPRAQPQSQSQPQPQFQPRPVPAQAQRNAPRAAPLVNVTPDLPEMPNYDMTSPESLQTGKDSHWNYISEVRLGVYFHDQGMFSHNKETGIDGGAEVLFVSPDFMKSIWSPRPHLGISVNSYGKTSQAYFGVTWEWDFWKDYFFNFGWGGSVNNGKTTTDDVNRKELGCHLLFREAIDFGYRFNQNHSLMFHMDHISNGKLCSENEGLESVGLRYGYKF